MMLALYFFILGVYGRLQNTSLEVSQLQTICTWPLPLLLSNPVSLSVSLQPAGPTFLERHLTATSDERVRMWIITAQLSALGPKATPLKHWQARSILVFSLFAQQNFKEKVRFPNQAELTQVVRWKGFRGNLRTEWNEGSDWRMNVKGKGCQNDSRAFEVNVFVRITSPPKLMWSRLWSC